MQTTKKLLDLYNKAKDPEGLKKEMILSDGFNIGSLYSFDHFRKDIKEFIKDIRSRKFIASMKVSKSGMTRHFNTTKYNALLNICYNQKITHDPVKVSGCGMDMYWYLLFTTCECILTRKDVDKWNINSLCSYQGLL